MGSKKKRNKDYVKRGPNVTSVVPGFEKIDQLADSIEAPFLKSRTHAYVESARELADALGRFAGTNVDEQNFQEGVSYELKNFGKDARLIDFILSVSGSARYQSESGRYIARAICQAVDMRLAPYMQKQDNGVIALIKPGTSQIDLVLTVQTQSKSGRWLARQFAHFVPHASAS